MGVDTVRTTFPVPTSVDRPEVSLIVPVYNEASPQRADAFRAMLDSSLTMLSTEFPDRHELIVINDGSTDGTAAIAHEFGVTTLEHDDGQNHGKGASVRLGMLAAKGRSRVMTDADGSYSPETLLRLADTIGGAVDIAVAYREQAGHESRLREVGHAALGRLCDVIAPTDSIDTQAGAKAFTAEAAEVIWPLVRADRYAADRQAMHLAHRLGYRVTNVPAEIQVMPGSHVRIVRDSLRMIADTARFSRFHKIPRP